MRNATLFLSAEDVARIVAWRGLANCFSGIMEYIREDYLRWPSFEKSARAACHSPQGVIELMPIADGQHYSFKYVNGHPGNTRAGLSTVMAFGVLSDCATGTPRLLSELTLATALRTAATSVLAAFHLARNDSRCMAMIGCGAQSEFQALAFHRLLGIQQLRVFDCDPLAMHKLARNLRGTMIELECCADTQEAVRGADIITTITADKRRASILHDDMVCTGMHINAVGGDCPGKTELDAAILQRADIFIEYEAQTRIEGEIQQLRPDHPVTELWRVLSGQTPGRRSDEAITVFDSVGFALEDFSTLRFLSDAAHELGVGHPVELVAAPADPKNLFAQITSVPVDAVEVSAGMPGGVVIH